MTSTTKYCSYDNKYKILDEDITWYYVHFKMNENSSLYFLMEMKQQE